MPKLEAKSMDEVNHILNRLARRSFKTSVGLLSPVIFDMSKDVVGEDGLVGQLLIPVAGTLTKIWAYVPGVNKDRKPQFNVELRESEIIATSRVITMTKEIFSGNLAQDVPEGSILTIRISDTSFKGILISAVFMPQIGNYKALTYLHDQIEVAADEGVRNPLIEAITSGAEERSTESDRALT